MMANQQLIVFDLDSTRRNFDGDENLIRDIGQIFVEDVPVLVQQLVQVRSRLKDNTPQETAVLQEAQRLAHSLKGLAGTFGAEPLGSLLAEIEREPRLLSDPDSENRLEVLNYVAMHTVDELMKCLKEGV
jgi:HPt (histidine-containing phosphotransfer) domain-containing protein